MIRGHSILRSTEKYAFCVIPSKKISIYILKASHSLLRKGSNITV